MYKRSKQGELNRLASLPRREKHWRWKLNPSVSNVHAWLNREYGSATLCEAEKHDYLKVVKKFDYALIHGKKYARNRKNFKMLCRSCHLKYDWTQERQIKVVKNLNRKGYWIKSRLKMF